DRTLKVIAAPWHEADEDVTSQRQLAVIGARTVSDHVAFEDPLTFANRRLLIDTRVLVGPLELGELVNVAANLAGQLPRMVLAFNPHDDPFRVNRINDAVASSQDHSSGVAGGDAFHS